MTMHEQVDAVVIGAGTRGLVATYLLSVLGYRAVLLDKAPSLGAADGSFQIADGTWFDFGMHVLDEGRSPLATRLFRHVVDGRVNRLKLNRAMVLRNQLIPYAPTVDSLPDGLRSLVHGRELVDDIGDELPTRKRIARLYGQGFADLIYDEVLPSYPTEHRHAVFGVDEAELLANIYPWFFPRAQRAPKHGDMSRAFHDKLRSGIAQYILYPLKGGFGEFARGFARHYDTERIEVLTGAKDIEVIPERDAHRIACVRGNGRTFRAPVYFWAAGWPELCRLLQLECQEPATDRIVLGSFRFNRPALTDYHEILVGDPGHQINRVSFPGAFRGSDPALLQIEFAFPIAEQRSLDAGEWRQRWIESLERLGLLDRRHEVLQFDFKTRPLHFNGYGMEGQRLIDADPNVLGADTNVYPIAPSMANLNLNAHVAAGVEYVTRVLANEHTAPDDAK